MTPRYRSHINDKRGISIVDAMIALSIALVGGLAFFNMVIYAQKVTASRRQRETLAILKNNYYTFLADNASFEATYSANLAPPGNFSCFSVGPPYNACLPVTGTISTVCTNATCSATYPIIGNGFDNNGNNCAGAPSAGCPILPTVKWAPMHVTGTMVGALIQVTVSFALYNGTFDMTPYGFTINRFAPRPYP